MMNAGRWLVGLALACAASAATAQTGDPTPAPTAPVVGAQPGTAGADAPAEAAPAGEAAEEEPVSGEAAAAHAADTEEDGKWFTADGIPTFHVENGAVDWYTFSGYRRYHAECHVCHGPDGQGSSYAPKIANSAVTMDYYDFVDVVVNGRQVGNSVMPAFGTNQNVMCYLDDIYIYLKAVGTGEIPRGRPSERADKPDAATEAENACMG
jgi:methanol metabolism-related c-type cytochrome